MLSSGSLASSVKILCGHCTTPIADFFMGTSGASLMIIARHHGEKHATLIPLTTLASYML
jgi:hypothetical protein